MLSTHPKAPCIMHTTQASSCLTEHPPLPHTNKYTPDMLLAHWKAPTPSSEHMGEHAPPGCCIHSWLASCCRPNPAAQPHPRHVVSEVPCSWPSCCTRAASSATACHIGSLPASPRTAPPAASPAACPAPFPSTSVPSGTIHRTRAYNWDASVHSAGRPTHVYPTGLATSSKRPSSLARP